MKRLTLWCVLALVAGGSAGPALADRDQDRARAAVLAGQVLPLRTVLEQVLAAA